MLNKSVLNWTLVPQLQHLSDRLLHPGLGVDDVMSDHDKLYIKTQRELGRQLQLHVRLCLRAQPQLRGGLRPQHCC